MRCWWRRVRSRCSLTPACAPQSVHKQLLEVKPTPYVIVHLKDGSAQKGSGDHLVTCALYERYHRIPAGSARMCLVMLMDLRRGPAQVPSPSRAASTGTPSPPGTRHIAADATPGGGAEAVARTVGQANAVWLHRVLTAMKRDGSGRAHYRIGETAPTRTRTSSGGTPDAPRGTDGSGLAPTVPATDDKTPGAAGTRTASEGGAAEAAKPHVYRVMLLCGTRVALVETVTGFTPAVRTGDAAGALRAARLCVSVLLLGLCTARIHDRVVRHETQQC
eukprot:m.358396 g.358396  ORF g.358396 m.358396 type:complete len:276 (+) comp20758_c0_seq4:2341-3168(+)